MQYKKYNTEAVTGNRAVRIYSVLPEIQKLIQRHCITFLRTTGFERNPPTFHGNIKIRIDIIHTERYIPI